MEDEVIWRNINKFEPPMSGGGGLFYNKKHLNLTYMFSNHITLITLIITMNVKKYSLNIYENSNTPCCRN